MDRKRKGAPVTSCIFVQPVGHARCKPFLVVHEIHRGHMGGPDVTSVPWPQVLICPKQARLVRPGKQSRGVFSINLKYFQHFSKLFGILASSNCVLPVKGSIPNI